MKNTRLNAWLPFLGLLLVSLVPVLLTVSRLSWLFSGPEVTSANPEQAHYVSFPLPIVSHIVFGSAYCLLASLQFSPVLKPGRSAWHKWAGRTALICGLVAAFSGVAMLFIYPPADVSSLPAAATRFVAGVAMIWGLGVAYVAVRRREFALHRAWMIRSLALGLAGSTQGLLLILWIGVMQQPLTRPVFAIAIPLGWAINLAVAEWRILRAGPRVLAPMNVGA